MKDRFVIRYGSHAFPLAHGKSFHTKRKDAEQVRRWWVDTLSPNNLPGDRWAVIRDRKHAS